jgi:hypothetical protein
LIPLTLPSLASVAVIGLIAGAWMIIDMRGQLRRAPLLHVTAERLLILPKARRSAAILAAVIVVPGVAVGVVVPIVAASAGAYLLATALANTMLADACRRWEAINYGYAVARVVGRGARLRYRYVIAVRYERPL